MSQLVRRVAIPVAGRPFPLLVRDFCRSKIWEWRPEGIGEIEIERRLRRLGVPPEYLRLIVTDWL